METLRQEKFNIPVRILHKFIPLISFYEISSGYYFDSVKPYEEIFFKELRNDILKFHIVSKYKPTINKLSPR